MKLTKEQWKQLSDRIFLTLRPTQHPVAMKFIKTPEEFDAIPDIEFCQNKASTCKLIGMAAHFQGTFGLTPDHFSGYYCAMNNGCMELTQEFLGGAILYKAINVLETITLDKESAHFKAQLAQKYADIVYNGQWFTPLREALDAFADSLEKTVTGDVKLKLYKGNMINAGVTSPYTLYDEQTASFGVDKDYDQSDATGFINLFGLSIKERAKLSKNWPEIK